MFTHLDTCNSLIQALYISPSLSLARYFLFKFSIKFSIPTVIIDVVWCLEFDIGNTDRLGVSLFCINHRLYRTGRHPDGLGLPILYKSQIIQNRETPRRSVFLCQTPDTIQHLLLQCKKHNISTLLKDQCTIYKLEPNLRSMLDVCRLYTNCSLQTCKTHK